MSKAKVWLIVAAVLVLVGAVIFALASKLDWSFNVEYETNTHDITEEFYGISIDTDTAGIELIVSDESKVVCLESENERHEVSVKDGTLFIKKTDNRKWYEYIGISFGSPKISVYLTKAQYASLDIKASTGAVSVPSGLTFANVNVGVSTGAVDFHANVSGRLEVAASTGAIKVSDIDAGALTLRATTGKISVSDVNLTGGLTLSVSTGKTELENVTCESLLSSGSTGRLVMKAVTVSGRLDIERDTGDVVLEKCDADEVYIETDTGNVRASFLTEKIIFADTDTGDIDIPKSTVGGRCEIETDTGNIKVSFEK